jgi:Kef-type K+ transport system membrane component KefB/Trk K+ transport system NAD-binding subunit
MDHSPFLALLLITVLALVVPILSARLRRFYIPIVVGEIIAGIIIGQSGLNLIEPSQTLRFLAEFGFAYLMFLSGLEVDFELLLTGGPYSSNKSFWKRPLTLAAILLLGTLSLALLFSWFLSLSGLVESPILIGLILSTTSLGIVVPVLKERDLLGLEFGQYILVAASVADFVTLLLLTIVIAIRSQGLTLDLLLVPALLTIFAIAVRGMRRVSELGFLQTFLDELSSATAQIRVRGAFALMVAWVVLAEALGVELILGAFLAGVIAGLLDDQEGENAREKLDAIGYGFFIPIFFIMVGVEFNLHAIVESPQALLLVPLLVVIAYLVKVIPALLLRVQFNWRETFAGGFLISARLSLIIAASAIAVSLGLISEALNAAIILLAIVSCTLSPILFNRILPASEEKRRRGIILIGQDQLTEFLVERLLTFNEPVAIICPDDSRKAAFQRLAVDFFEGCADLPAAFAKAGAADARVLVDLTMSSEETLNVCTIARETYHIPLVISRISDVELIPRLQRLGVKVVQPTLATVMAIEGALRYPMIFDLLMDRGDGDIGVVELRIGNPSITDVPLRKMRLPGDALIVSMSREGNVMIPQGDLTFKLGDRVGIIGSSQSIERAAAMLRR